MTLLDVRLFQLRKSKGTMNLRENPSMLGTEQSCQNLIHAKVRDIDLRKRLEIRGFYRHFLAQISESNLIHLSQMSKNQTKKAHIRDISRFATKVPSKIRATLFSENKLKLKKTQII